MSEAEKKMSLDYAVRVAGHWVTQLAPYCQRIEIAGSVRRKKPLVGDVEIVLIPKMSYDMFGTKALEEPLPITLYLLAQEREGVVRFIKNGLRYKQFVFREPAVPYQPKVDLFLVVPPAEWGVIFTMRTGSADFSHHLVSEKKYGGAMPGYLQQKDGYLCRRDTGEKIPTPEEADYFEALGIDYVKPEDR